MSAPYYPLTCNQDHSYTTLCFLQSDPYPRAYSRTEACLDPHISPDQNLQERKNKNEIEIQIFFCLKYGLCHYVVRLKHVTENEAELKRSIQQQNHSQRISFMCELMCAAASEPSIIHADLKLLERELVRA